MQTIMGTPANMDDRTVVITIVHNPCNEAMCEVQNHLIEMRWPNPPFARSLPRNRRGFYPNAQGMTNRFRGI